MQALIVPTFGNDNVDAGIARFEWTLIAQELAQGKSVTQAIDDANSSIHVTGLFTTPVPSTLNWYAIGDTILKLRKKSQ